MEINPDTLKRAEEIKQEYIDFFENQKYHDRSRAYEEFVFYKLAQLEQARGTEPHWCECEKPEPLSPTYPKCKNCMRTISPIYLETPHP